MQPIAKVFEKVLGAQVVYYFEVNNLFYSDQHGFRTNHSCETVLQSILYSWKVSIANKQLVLSLFIDFKKAFDLINPYLLFLKLFHNGFDRSI